MKQSTRARILKIFHEQSGYARTHDIRKHGIHHSYLTELQKEGFIIKVKHGLYSLAVNENYNSLKEAQLAIPDGILCLGTAITFYGLSTWDPPSIQIAVPKGRKIMLPEYPPIQLFYFSGDFYATGRTEERLESGGSVYIYNREKTICDIIRYRNRIGIDIMKEALREYLNSEEKNLNQLNFYAKKLKISSVLNQYLEVLI